MNLLRKIPVAGGGDIGSRHEIDAHAKSARTFPTRRDRYLDGSTVTVAERLRMQMPNQKIIPGFGGRLNRFLVQRPRLRIPRHLCRDLLPNWSKQVKLRRSSRFRKARAAAAADAI